MKRYLHVIYVLLCLFLLPYCTRAQQTVSNGQTTQPIKMPGSACVYWWSADKPETGIQASGIGNTVPAFVANNAGSTPVTVTVNVSLPGGGAFDNVPVAFIVTQLSGSLWTYSMGTNNIALNRVYTQSEPYGIAISPDRTRIYVSNKTSKTVSVFKYKVTNLTPPINVSHVIDIDVGTDPKGLVCSPDGSKVYVVNSGDATISVLSTASNTEIKKIPITGALQPTGIAISADGSTLYVSNNGSGTVTVVRTSDGQVTNSIPVGTGPLGIAISPDGKFVYVACQVTNTVSVINTASLASPPAAVPVGLKPFGVAISPGGGTVYVSNQGDNTVTAINTANTSDKKTFTVGTSPTGISVSPDGTVLYVGNFGSNEVSKLDIASGQVTKFDQDGGPFSLGNFISGPSGCTIPPQPYTITINPTPPTITPSGSPSALSIGQGVASASTNFTVSGLSLPQGILVIPPSGFEVSLDDENFSPTLTVGAAGNIVSTTVYIRLKAGDTQGTYSGNIAFSSGSATATLSMPNSIVRAPEPTIITSKVTGSIFTCTGTPSASPNMLQTIVSAVNLNGVLGASASTGFEVSLSPDKGFASHIDISYDADVPNTTIYVRSSTDIKQGTNNGTISFASGPIHKELAVSAIAYFIPVANPPAPLTQEVVNRKLTAPIHFSGTGNTFNWVCDNPNINLATSGVGDIPSFQAVNDGNDDITATITAWPVSAPLSYVANFGANEVSVISINTNELIASIRVPAAPKYILISPDASRLYVSCYAADSVSVIDAGLNKEIARIKVGSLPQGMSLNADGSILSVYNSGGDGSVSFIDTRTNTLINTTDVEKYPPGTIISPDGKKAYVYDYAAMVNSFNVYDTETNKLLAHLPGITSPQGLVLSPDGNTIYLTDATDISPTLGRKHLLHVIDAGDYHEKITPLNLGDFPQGLAITHDGKKLYIAIQDMNRVSVINTETYETEYDVEVGHQPASVATTDGTGCEGVPVTCTIIIHPTPPTITAKGLPDAMTTIQGNPSAPASTFIVSGIKMQEGILVSPPNGFEVSLDGNNFSPTVTIPLTRTDGVIPETTVYIRIAGSTMVGKYSGDIVLSSKKAEDVKVPMPECEVYLPTSSILVTSATGSINTCEGTPSSSPNILQFTASGFLLAGDITVSAPQGFEVSLNANSNYNPSLILSQSGGNAAKTTIYVRSSSSAKGSISGDIQLKTPGATNRNVFVKANVGVTPTINQVSNQTKQGGMATDPVNFTGTNANTYAWTNDNTTIGLTAGGYGNIASFTAVNKGGTVQVANIKVRPLSAALAYVAMEGSNRISVINTSSNTPVINIAVGSVPYAVAASPDGNFVYVANQGSNNVSVITTNTNTEVKKIPVGQAPSGLVVSADGKKVYVANGSSNDVTIIDVANNYATSKTSVGITPEGIALSPDGKTLYVANRNSTNVSVINTETLEQTKITTGKSPTGVAVSPDGTHVYITNYTDRTVTVIDANNTVIPPAISVGINPRGIVISADGKFAYVANQGSSTVSVINTQTNAVSTLNVGNSPQGISITPDGSLVYVANSGANSMSVISTATNTVTATISNVGAIPVSFGNFITGGAGCVGPEMAFKITVNPETAYITTTGTLPALSTTYGTPSSAGAFDVTGVSLTSAITVSPPPGLEVSTDLINYKPALTFTPVKDGQATTVYVRLSATAPAITYTGKIDLSSPGAASIGVNLTPPTKVDPAPLDLIANKVTKTVNTSLAGGPGSKAFTYTGIKNNETIASVTITYGAGADISAAIGTYTASVVPSAPIGGTFTASNYSINPVAADLIVSNIISADLIKIPNTFSPNGDGINDTWKINYLLNYPDCTVNIFDRSGRKIFHSTGYALPWDGTFAGQALPYGTYYYVIDIDKGTRHLSGYVLLVR